MEIHLFAAGDVDEKLQEVINNLNLINYVIKGMAELYSIDDDSVSAVNGLICRALRSANQLTQSRSTMALKNDPGAMFYKSSLIPGEGM